MASTIIAVDEDNFEAEVVNSALPVLIDFWAPWCAPCRALLPALEALAPMYSDALKIVKIDIDASPALKAKFNVQSIPQLYLASAGAPIARLVSRTRTQLAAELDDILP
ncbi:thioredoxin family protein [Novosphingobium taihuense]|uniref:Thioredoxin n=1 Tax=Novosphingobium taihuense TaxID=260085 RepID=A0A7W7ES81_9SPHN|nr:thioredoxin domain-containing protein [Novosphingobium taihuense]MBB4611927.1 thioredoxin 1 [Novosphingobium taihuense]TWH88720.1 thioredoxin [Novosphingobium taihuense]